MIVQMSAQPIKSKRMASLLFISWARALIAPSFWQR
jgi:hypothetical protein